MGAPTATRCRVAAHRLLWPCVVLGLAACIGGGAYVAEDAPPPEEIRSVLLVAMNFDVVPPAELRRGTALLQTEVHEYLARTGRDVRQARLYEVMRHWKALAEAADGFTSEDGEDFREEAYEAARAELSRRLAEVHSVDAIVMPTLLVRDGHYTGVSMIWDGVSRRVPIDEEAGSIMTTHAIAGEGKGTSLRMTLYAPDGRKLFERYAGIEPMMAWTMRGFGRAAGGSIVGMPRRDLFRDPEIITDAVTLSFRPLIEPPGGEATD